MPPDYSEYSQKELHEALASIVKDSYPENYEKLVLELSKRDSPSGSNESLVAMETSSQRRNTPCSFKRISTVIALGVLGSIPVVAQAEPSKLSKEGFVYSVLIILMSGLPLLHSFLCSWTISRHGIVRWP